MFAVGATYGVRISRNVGVGLGVKYFRDKLADDNVLQLAQLLLSEHGGLRGALAGGNRRVRRGARHRRRRPG